MSTKSFTGTRRSEGWFGFWFWFWFVSPERVERQRSIPTSRHRHVTDRRYTSTASLERQRNGKKIIFFKVIIIFLKTLCCKCGNIIMNLWNIEKRSRVEFHKIGINVLQKIEFFFIKKMQIIIIDVLQKIETYTKTIVKLSQVKHPNGLGQKQSQLTLLSILSFPKLSVFVFIQLYCLVLNFANTKCL